KTKAAIAALTPAVQAAPEALIRELGEQLQVTRSIEHFLPNLLCGTNDQVPSIGIGFPEAQTFRALYTEDKPAIEDDQGVATGSPAERSADPHRLKVDEVQTGLITIIEVDQQVAGVQIAMKYAGVVHARQQLAQRHGQALTDARLAQRGQMRPFLCDEFIDWLGILEGARDEETLSRRQAAVLLAQGQGSDGWHLPRSQEAGTSRLTPRLPRSGPGP